MGKKNTYEKVKEIFLKNEIELLSKTYVNSKTEMLCKCIKCEKEFKTILNRVQNGSGCPYCAKIYRSNSRKLQYEDVKQRFYNKGFDLIDTEYIKRGRKMFCKCIKHHTELFLSLEQIETNVIGCKKCILERRYTQGKKFTYQDVNGFIKNTPVIIKEDINLHTVVISTDVLNLYCTKHKKDFNLTFSHLKRNSTCPLCAQENRKKKQLIKIEDVQKEFERKGYELIDKDKYDGIFIPLRYKCPYHLSIISKISYDSLKRGHGCPYCANNGKKTKEEIGEIFENNGFSLNLSNLSNNVNSFTLISCICKKTQKETKLCYETVLKRGHVCPYCNSSKGEDKINKYLVENKIDFETQYCFKRCFNKNLLRFDFFLKDYNMCIEYQGEQHYMKVNFSGKMTEKQMEDNFESNKKRDNIKREFCKKNNIKLLEISYLDFNEINNILERQLNV